MPHSQIFIDQSKTLTLRDVQKNDLKFIKNEKKLLGFGYSPDFNVWIKFTLKNSSDKDILKIIEYDNALTTNVKFFSPDTNYTPKQDGLFNIHKDRKTINPIFKITLKAHESKTYYIQVSSYITTLIVKLNLWENESFYNQESNHRLIIGLFFGAMIILAVYNIFIYFITRDLSYLFYVLYIVGILVHHVLYIGFTNIYLIPPTWNEHIIKYASIIVGVPAFALAIFTKSFLKTNQYRVVGKILNIYLILFPFLLSIFIITDEFNKYRNIFSVLLLILLLFITIYASFKKNRQAYFILFGWSVFISAGIFMYLSSIGFFNIYNIFPYYTEVSLVIEAVVFSIALADRIKQLQKDKEDTNLKLIDQQKNEQKRLEQQVLKKTHDLKVTLDEKDLLLKELNHRVKNNMQTIVSLIRLQADEIEDEQIQEIFITIQNRINSMSHLHELLYKQDNISYINAYDYFDILIEEVKESYNSNANIMFDIQTELKMDQAVYCGLILNELISNSCKHAFKTERGNIFVSLYKKENMYELIVKDDGIGYNKEISTDSLGLILINTLVKEQLKGKIDIDTSDGVNVKICWSYNE